MDRPLSLIEELLLAILAADDNRRREGLRVLRGESVTEIDSAPQTGPMLMRMGEAARYLGVSRTTLWRMIRDERLEHVEMRRDSFRLRKIDLDRLAGIRGGRRGETKAGES